MSAKHYKLGDICRFEKGLSPTLKTDPGPYPLVVTADFRRSASTYQLEGPAVCVPLISSTGHGDAAIHRVHYQEGKFALANLLVALLPNDSTICNAKYLYHLLMARKDELLVPLMLGTANVSLKEKDIAEVEIILPTLAEQWRIVARIEDLAEKIKEVNGLRESISTDEYQMLSASFASLIAGSTMRTMEEVAPITRRPVLIKMEEGYHELGIRSFGKGTFHKPPLRGIEVGTKKLFYIEPGDLVFSNVFAWEGAVAVAKQEDSGRVGSHRFIACVPRKGISTASFLCFYFLTEEGLKKLGDASPGGAGRNRTLALESLGTIEVPLPTYEKQLCFDNLQAKVNGLKKFQSETAAELGALLPSILDKALKGEL